MKFISILIIFLVFQDAPEVLSDYNSVNRLILIFSNNNQSEAYNRELLEMAKDPLGMAQRDVLIFEIFMTGGIKPDGSALTEQQSQSLWKYYNLEEENFAIVLLNKQSREVFRSFEPVNAAEIIKAFDQDVSSD